MIIFDFTMIFVFCFLFALIIADPVPIGGAVCAVDTDCGGVGAGKCTNNTCLCPPQLANISCSYKRYDADLAGALNIALPFVGVGGIGNFIIRRTGFAVGQLILMLSIYIVLIPICVLACCSCCGGKKTKFFSTTLGIIIVIVAILAGFAGFIWSIIDGAFMLQGKIVDGNGFDLYIK